MRASIVTRHARWLGNQHMKVLGDGHNASAFTAWMTSAVVFSKAQVRQTAMPEPAGVVVHWRLVRP